MVVIGCASPPPPPSLPSTSASCGPSSLFLHTTGHVDTKNTIETEEKVDPTGYKV